jgi:hypothetical protein
MKQAIRALGWTATILWILVILFSGTVVYSAMQIGMNFEEDSQVTTSNGALTMSIPFSISNGGLYDISELNITTRIEAENETIISRSTTLVPSIPKTGTVDETHDITLSLDDILDKNLTYMLFNDANLSVDMFVGLTYAYAIPLRISSNLTMPWGAPLSNLTVGEITELSPSQANVSLSFENHAFFSLNGTIRLDIADRFDRLMGTGTTDVFVSPEGSYDDVIAVALTSDLTERAEVRVYFDTSLFSFGPVVIAVD